MSRWHLTEDGETRLIGNGHGRTYKVLAERVDWDSPLMHIVLQRDAEPILTLTDFEAEQLIADLQKAIQILPSSK